MACNFTLSNGVKMPAIGLGTWQSKPGEIALAVETAIESGYRLIDTAFVYGNEKEIGESLQKLFKKGTVKREELFITTKLHMQYLHKEDVEPMLRKQLQALQLDYVDLYLIHGPCGIKKVEGKLFPFDQNGMIEADPVDHMETWKGMEEVYKKGLTKSIGLSNFSLSQIQRIYDESTVKPHNLQSECHGYWPQNELYELCKKLNILMTAYAPIGSPGSRQGALLQGAATERPVLMEEEIVKSIATKHKKTPSQVLLRWLIQRGINVIPKSTNAARIKENFNIFDFKLSDDEFNKLSNIPRRERLFEVKMFENHPQYSTSDPH
jgi:alcohol dehydrogenase (NADP+)